MGLVLLRPPSSMISSADAHLLFLLKWYPDLYPFSLIIERFISKSFDNGFEYFPVNAKRFGNV